MLGHRFDTTLITHHTSYLRHLVSEFVTFCVEQTQITLPTRFGETAGEL